MSDVNIVGKISVDAGASVKSISDLKKEINEAKKALDGAAIGSKDYKEAQDKLNKSTGELSSATGKQAGAFGNLKQGLGEIIPGFSGASQGADGLGKKLLMLAANPILLVLAAIVGALVLLYKAFANSFEGGEKLEQVFNGIKAAGQSLFDNLDKIAGALVKVFTFDFSGAIEDIKEVGDQAGATYKAMANLTKVGQKLKIEQRANDLDQAERQKRLAILREQADDDTIPAAKRKAALLQLKTDAEQNSKDDIALAKKVTENKISELTLQKDGARKNADEINKLKIEQVNVETQNANELRRIGKQLLGFKRQEAAESKQLIADQKAEQKILDDEEKIRFDKRQKELDAFTSKTEIDAYIKKEDDRKAKLAKEDADNAKALASMKGTLTKTNEANQQSIDTQIKNDNLLAETKANNLQAGMQLANAAIELFGRQSIVGKGIAAGMAAINTYSAIAANLSAFGKVPIPGYAIAQAVATGIFGLLNVKKILSTPLPGGGGGGSAPSLPSAGGGTTAPLTPRPATTSLDASSINAVGQASQGGTGRTFVLDSDIKSSQERQARLQRAARI